jgi:hypothetical protein
MTRTRIARGYIDGVCSSRAPGFLEFRAWFEADANRVRTNGDTELAIGWSQGIAVMLKSPTVPHMHLIRADCHDETEPDRAVGQLRGLTD